MSARPRVETGGFVSQGRGASPSRRAALARLQVALWPLLRSGHVYVQVFAAQLRDGVDVSGFPSPADQLDYSELIGLLEEVGGYVDERAALDTAWEAAVTIDRAAASA